MKTAAAFPETKLIPLNECANNEIIIYERVSIVLIRNTHYM